MVNPVANLHHPLRLDSGTPSLIQVQSRCATETSSRRARRPPLRGGRLADGDSVFRQWSPADSGDRRRRRQVGWERRRRNLENELLDKEMFDQ